MPKLENPDLVDQFEKNELGESAHQAEDDLRVESGGPLGVRQRRGEIPPTGSIRLKKEIGRPSIKKIAQPEDILHTFTDTETRVEIDNPGEALFDGIVKRLKKQKETKRYFSIGDRRRKQQAQNKINVKVKKGELPPPIQVWRHPSLEEDNVNANLKWVAKKRNQTKIRGGKWPIVEEKK